MKLDVMNTTYVIERGKPVVYLICRNKLGQRFIIQDDTFRPHFSIPRDEIIPETITIGTKEYKTSKIITNITEEGLSLDKIPLKRLTYKYPFQTYTLRSVFEKHFEANVLFHYRYMIDRGIVDAIEVENLSSAEVKPAKASGIHPRICYIDIEVDKEVFEQELTFDDPIVLIVLYDTHFKRYYAFIWHPSYQDNDVENLNNLTIYYRDSEKKLLQELIKRFHWLQPDVIAGWNIESFDMPYIFKRCEKLNIMVDKFSPLYGSARNLVRYGKNKPKGKHWIRGLEPSYNINIKGCQVFDLMVFYKLLTIHRKTPPYSLEHIAEIELKKSKLECNVPEVWRRNPFELIKYCLNDVILSKEIDEQSNLIGLYESVRRLAGINLRDAFYKTKPGKIIMMRRSKLKLPSTSPEKSKFEGGLVLDPERDIFFPLINLDFAALYPNIFVMANISPDTLDPEGTIILGDNQEYKYLPEPMGLLPKIIEEFADLRFKVKSKLKDHKYDSKEYKSLYRQQFALKQITNAMYGVAKLLFGKSVPDSVTWLGRKIMEYTRDEVLKLGHRLVYGDTDSVFIVPHVDLIYDEEGRVSNEQIQHLVDIGNSIAEKITKTFPRWLSFKFGIPKESTKRIQLELEEIAERAVFLQKKRYALALRYKENKILDEPDLVIVGSQARRSDSAGISITLQKNIYRSILLEKQSKEKIFSKIMRTKKILKDGKVHLNAIGIPQTMGQEFKDYKVTNPHLRGCKYSNIHFKQNYGKGTHVRMLYVKPFHNTLDMFRMTQTEVDLEALKKYPSTNEICFINADDIPLDFWYSHRVAWSKMIPLVVDNVLRDVIEIVQKPGK